MDKIYLAIFILLVSFFLYVSSLKYNIENFSNENFQNALGGLNLGDCSAKFIIENGIGLLRKIDNIERNLKKNNEFISKIRNDYYKQDDVMKKMGENEANKRVNQQKKKIAKDMGVSISQLNKMAENPKIPTKKQAKMSSLRHLKSLF